MRMLDERRAAALALAAPLSTVVVGLEDALGAVLARDVRTTERLPGWDNSALDGTRCAPVTCGPPPTRRR